jgi:hypothetical protein
MRDDVSCRADAWRLLQASAALVSRRTFLMLGRVKEGGNWVTRIGTFAVLVFAFVVPAFIGTPKKLPGIALGSAFVWYLEVAFVVLGIIYVALNLLVRGVWHGALPVSISREGLTFAEEIPAEMAKAIDALQGQIDSLEKDLAELVSRVILR